MRDHIPETEVSKEETRKLREKLDAGLPLNRVDLYFYALIMRGYTTGIGEPVFYSPFVVVDNYLKAYHEAKGTGDTRYPEELQKTALALCTTRIAELDHYRQNQEPMSLSFESLDQHIKSLQGVVDLIGSEVEENI